MLIDRSGNSLDRAMLLYELLRLAGHDVRLARGVLTEDVGPKDLLADAFRPARDGRFDPPVRSSASMDAVLAADAPGGEAGASSLRAAVDELAQEGERVRQAVRGRVEHQSRALAAAVGLPQGHDEHDETEHVYVVARPLVGRAAAPVRGRIALDVSLRDGHCGHGARDEEAGMQPSETHRSTQEDLHRLNVRVTLEASDGSAAP